MTKLFRSFSRVRKLRLEWCNLSATFIARFLQCFPLLQECHITGCPVLKTPIDETFSTPSLRHRQKTLAYLHTLKFDQQQKSGILDLLQLLMRISTLPALRDVAFGAGTYFFPSEESAGIAELLKDHNSTITAVQVDYRLIGTCACLNNLWFQLHLLSRHPRRLPVRPVPSDRAARAQSHVLSGNFCRSLPCHRHPSLRHLVNAHGDHCLPCLRNEDVGPLTRGRERRPPGSKSPAVCSPADSAHQLRVSFKSLSDLAAFGIGSSRGAQNVVPDEAPGLGCARDFKI